MSIKILDTKTHRLLVNDLQLYATPLLHPAEAPKLRAPQELVLANLCKTERRLQDLQERVAAFKGEMNSLIQAGYVKQITAEEAKNSEKSWYLATSSHLS